MIALIDGDIVAYRAAAACEHRTYEARKAGRTLYEAESHREMLELLKERGIGRSSVEIVPIIHQQPVGVLHKILHGTMAGIMGATGAMGSMVFLSPGRTFRHKIACTRPYKGNRDKQQKPVLLQEAKRLLVQEYGAIIGDNVEADDLMGVHQTAGDGGTVIVTVDKDMLQVPGTHYNWVKDEWQFVTEEQGERFLATQVLMGDSTDNIPGLPKVGEVKAAEILGGTVTRKEIWDAVRGAYKNTQDAPPMDEQYRLVYVLRTDEELSWASTVV